YGIDILPTRYVFPDARKFYIRMGAEDARLADQSFDVLFMTNLIKQGNPTVISRLLTEAQRLLRPEGLLHISPLVFWPSIPVGFQLVDGPYPVTAYNPVTKQWEHAGWTVTFQKSAPE